MTVTADDPVGLESVGTAQLTHYAETTIEELARRADIEPVALTEHALILMRDNRTSSSTSKLPPNMAAIPELPDLREIGTTGQSSYNDMLRMDYNPKMNGLSGLRMYDQMRRNDGAVRASLRLVKTPITTARWYVSPVSNSKQDKKICEFISNCIFKWQTASWPQQLNEALLMLEFGHYAFEKVWAKKDGKIVLRKLAPRHPMDVNRWIYDSHGGPVAAEFYPLNGITGPYTIPIQKLAVFTYEKEAGNLQGISLLRSAYKHWFYKENLYKIDAIQKERHGVGIPVIVLPANYTPKDLKLADEMGRNLRSNEKAHIVVPQMWEIGFAKIEGQPVDAMKSVVHHNDQIADNILAPFFRQQTGQQTNASGANNDIFLKSVRYIADIVCDVFNSYIIPELVMWNFGTNASCPELKARRIGDTVDWRTISFALRNMVGAGLLVPDEDIETWIRNEMDLPPADVMTRRYTVKQTQPGYKEILPEEQAEMDAEAAEKAAVAQAQAQQDQPNEQQSAPTQPIARGPRQSQAGNSRQGKNAGSNGKVGVDRSGG